MKIRNHGRRSFTLLEILVVVALIGILMAIAVGAYYRAYVVADQVAARSDISQLGAALDKFKATYGRYPPSQIKLAVSYGTYNLSNPLDLDSVGFLTTVFGSKIKETWNKTGIDWSNGNGLAKVNFVILEGDQCLVFFLGGMVSVTGGTYSCLGFTNNPFDPTSTGGANVDGTPVYPYQGPTYQFKGNRLISLPHTNTGGDSSGIFPSDKDAYGKNVYAYFSGYNVVNGYNRYGVSDCSTLGVSPYAKAFTPLPGDYQNPESYQIICAGRDGQFGTGSGLPASPLVFWTPGTANVANPPGSAGADDLSNFSSTLLGVSK